MTAPSGRAPGLLIMRVVIALIGIGTIANSVANVVSFRANQARVEQINEERSQNVLRNCLDVNTRHRSTVRQLDALLEARLRSASPAERKLLKQSRANTVVLIDALVPERDCRALAARQVATK